MQLWQQHEEREALRTRVQEERYPTRGPMHWLLLVFRSTTLGLSVAMGLTQCVGIFWERLGVLDYILRVYAVLFCTLAVLNESNMCSFTQESKVLNWWITRGLLYGFIGVLGLSEQAVSSLSKTMVHSRVAIKTGPSSSCGFAHGG